MIHGLISGKLPWYYPDDYYLHAAISVFRCHCSNKLDLRTSSKAAALTGYATRVHGFDLVEWRLFEPM